MKKITDKFVKILMLVSMIFSSLQTPIQVFAKEIANNDSEIPVGSIKLGENGQIEESGSASTTKVENGISVTKTVSKTDTLGKYHVKFEVKGTKTETSRPVYVVVVFDRSGSMKENAKGKQDKSKWNNAVSGAKSFANSILTKIPNAKLGLVTFAEEASLARGFENANFEDVNNKSLFGSANGGTNLDAGLQKAQKLFQDTQIEDNALKYVVVMSDGKPTYYNDTCYDLFGEYVCIRGDGGVTTRSTLEATLKTADEVKKIATVYSIGYSLKNGYAYEGKYTYNGFTYNNQKLTAADILTKVATPAEQGKKYYYSADDKDQIVTAFSDIANQIVKSGTNAQIIDKLGSNFKLVNDDNNNYGIEKASEVYEELSDDTITFEFDIEIDQDASTGWHQTNAGFRLEYIDNNGVKQTINGEEDPYVYWVQKTYQYKVSYYKDSFDEGNKIATDTREAANGTVINIDNVEKDKYLFGRYQFDSIDPESITIINDGEVKEIKVLYTAEGTVTARYKDTNGVVLAQEETTTGIVGKDYTTNSKNIYGYTLVSEPTNKNGVYTYNEDNEPIYVDYIYTKNEGALEINDVIKTQINKITGANSTFKYILSYNGKLDNYVGKANLTLVDTLPYDVESIEYDENICSYDSITRKLTCSKEVEITEDNKDTILNTQIEVIVKYNKLTSTTDLEVKNIVDSKLVYGDNSATDNASVEDTIKASKVTAIYVDENDNTLANSEVTTGLIDNEYTTSEKTIYGYTLKEVSANKNGVYTEEEIIVKYVYTKNDGTVTKNEVVKTGLENVNSINGIFNYTLSYNGEIKDYKGIAKLTLVDTLPYELENGSTYEGCTYNVQDKTLICVKEFDITEENNKVEASFNLSLIFKNVDSDKITNKVKSTLEYGNNHNEDEDKTETEVFKGTVIARYLDEDKSVIAKQETSTDLGGKEYTTNEKTIYGYTLKEMPTNKNGKYAAKETIYVDYIYTKNDGVLVENDVVKTQINKIVGANSTFKYILSYNGKLDSYVGKANLTLVDTLPYDVESIEYDENICSYDSITRKLTCSKEVEITEDNKDTILNTQIEVIVKYNKLTSTTDLEVKNIVDSKLVYGDNSATDNASVEDTIKASKVTAIYVDEEDNTLASSEVSTGLIDNEYTTSEKDILGYTLKGVPANKNGAYTEEEIIVKYVYTKNIGTSEEDLKKVGLDEVTSIDEVFIYTITYNATIKDYVGDVKLVIVDKLPYEIDMEKSVIDTNNDDIECKYINGEIVCEYNKTINSENDNTIDIIINLELYFKNIDSDMVINKVESILTYGEEEKESKDETGTKVLSGTVIVNYVTEDGEELAPSEEMTGLVGEDYKTTKKAFDKYYLKEVKGNETGVYKEDTQEVTYVYSLIPLPPQTGYEGNNTNYLGLFILGLVMLFFKKRI